MATRATTERVGGSGLSDKQLALLLVLPTAVLLLLFSVYPVIQAAWDSFYRIPLATRAEEFIGLDNYRRIWQEESIRDAFYRTLLWTVTNVVVQSVLGLLIALVLNAKLRGQDAARGLVLFPYMVPAIVVATIFRFTFNDLTGIANYWLQKVPGVDQSILFLADPDIALLTVTMVNCWKYTPFMVIVLLARLQTVPRDLTEAARIDGANPLQSFRDVTFPWLRPVLLIALLLRTIWTVNDFDVIYLLAFGGPLGATTTVPIEIRRLAFGQQDLGLASALAIVMALLVATASFVYLRLYHRSEAQLN
ncbi:MAG: carbohydrate ABC transporter permease [Thermomicrobiales bacterium]